MSEVIITVNTVDKTVVATVDGAKIKGLQDIYITTEGDGDFQDFRISLSSFEDQGDMRKITHLIANKDATGSILPGFGEDVIKNIADCLLK